MRIVILGTSCVFPTKDRSQQAVLLKYGGENFLFDCGEGTQRQIRIAKESPMKITKIFITHWHGDHVLGLPGLIQSFAMSNRTKPLDIYGPKTSKEKVKYMLKSYDLEEKGLGFQLKVHELNIKKPVELIYESDNYVVLATNLKHRIPCIGYSFVEREKTKIKTDYLGKFGLSNHPIIKKLQKGKNILWRGKEIKAKDATFRKPGKKFTYVVDTLPVDRITKLAENSDVFVCEATFLNERKEEKKDLLGHLTAKDAGKLAKKANVKQLILTHFSQRYKNVNRLIKEARGVFKNTRASKDFMEISI